MPDKCSLKDQNIWAWGIVGSVAESGIMSLSLLQSYSSAEEEDDPQHLLQEELSTDDDSDDVVPRTNRSYKPLVDPNPASSSSLPSAFDAFSEVNNQLPRFLIVFAFSISEI